MPLSAHLRAPMDTHTHAHRLSRACTCRPPTALTHLCMLTCTREHTLLHMHAHSRPHSHSHTHLFSHVPPHLPAPSDTHTSCRSHRVLHAPTARRSSGAPGAASGTPLCGPPRAGALGGPHVSSVSPRHGPSFAFAWEMLTGRFRTCSSGPSGGRRPRPHPRPRAQQCGPRCLVNTERLKERSPTGPGGTQGPEADTR